MEDHRALGLGLGLGLETNLRGGSGYFSQKSLHERTTVKSVEDHRALGLGLGLETNLTVGISLRKASMNALQ